MLTHKEKLGIIGAFFIGLVLLLIIPPPVLAASKAEAVAKPKPEGTLIAAQNSLGEEGFLPDRNSNTAGPMWECVYDFLIYSNSSTLKPIPGVAEKWEYSTDYRTLTFHLRKGIQFHDGWGELTAEDVKWSFEFSGRPASVSIISTQFKKVKSIDVVDRYTVAIHLKEPDPTMWLNFCTGDNVSIPILCKKYIEEVGEDKANRQPIGSGPYRLVEQKLGDYAKFEAYESHWLVVPEFKYLILRVVAEESTRIAMLKTGETDIALDLSIDKKPELEKAGLRALLLRNSGAVFFPFGGMLLPEDKRYSEGYHRMDPWKDIRVREAMNIAIDRDNIAKNLYFGTATPAPIWAPLPGWDKLKPILYNPKRAKQLLAEAGYPQGFSFKLFIHGKEAVLPLIAQAAAGYWEAVGLKAEIIQGDYATWRNTIKAAKTAGYLYPHILSNFPEWSGRLSNYDLPGASSPFWQGNETNVAIKKVQGELEPRKREANFQELARLYRSLYSHVPIVYSPRLQATNKKVGEWPTARLDQPRNLIFARHAKPLNTWRLFTP